MALNGPEPWAPWAPWSHDSPSCMARSPQSSCKSSFVAHVALALGALGALRCKTARMPWVGWFHCGNILWHISDTKRTSLRMFDVWWIWADCISRCSDRHVGRVSRQLLKDLLATWDLQHLAARCYDANRLLCVCVSLVFLWFHNQMYFEIASLVAIQCCNGVQIPDQVWTENLMYSMSLYVSSPWSRSIPI